MKCPNTATSSLTTPYLETGTAAVTKTGPRRQPNDIHPAITAPPVIIAALAIAVAIAAPTLSSLSKWDVRGLFGVKRPHGVQVAGTR
jgi:hypothetical protein